MSLKEFLVQTGQSCDAFAQETGIDRSIIFRLVAGQGFPRRENILKISEATGGKVTANDFVRNRTTREKKA